jgi:hypothetical protein
VVVRIAITTEGPARRDYWWLLRATILLAVITVQPIPTQSAGLSSRGSSIPFALNGSAVSPEALSQKQVFDPAGAQFFSFWSYGAMSVIAPVIFGDFLPPTALSSGFGLNAGAPMPISAGTDPALASVLDSTLQKGFLPAGGAAEAEEFDITSRRAVVGKNGAGVDWTAAAVGGAIPISTLDEAGAIKATSIAGGTQLVCGDDQLERRLQAGGEFWNGQAASAMPVQFPPGLFTGPVEVGNPLGGLGPKGNPTNLSAPGQAGGWCRPPHGPFSDSSPLEDRFFWIGVGVVLTSFLVFLLSRGMKMPAGSF